MDQIDAANLRELQENARITVLDLSRVLAGPWATQIRGNLGADVVKIERDDTHSWGRWSLAYLERARAARAKGVAAE